ncbi:diguanylate cyclase [Novosphingobium sp.]|uniref:GGDEF domain-containing protein n=1 Tax=Novosphingobium sp. TaxID=1874826 RepID=UPI0031D9FB6A
MANTNLYAHLSAQGEPAIGQATAHKLPGAHPLAIPTVAGLFLLAHVLGIILFPRRADVISISFQVTAPLLAALACFLRRREGYAQGWCALALALIFWSAGLSINILELVGLPNPEPGPSISVLLAVLYGVPILFIVASPAAEALSVRVVDAALALALGALFFIHSFTFSSTGASNSSDVLNILAGFDAENLLIVLFAAIRFASSRDRQEREFFGALAVYALLYFLAAGYMNHAQHDTPYGGLTDLLIDVPFLFLMAKAAHANLGFRLNYSLSVRQERFVLAASPLMLPAMLLTVSAIVFRANPAWAIAGVAMATLGSGFRNVLTHMRNLEERDRLEQLAQIDTLTALPNRRCFDNRFRIEWSRAWRSRTALAVLMLDIDHFKMLNDGLGHAEGDRCLRAVADALGSCATRASDLVARYGGEEFVAILPSASPEQAMQFAELLGQTVHALNLPSPSPKGRVTISVGVGHAEHVEQVDPDTLLKAADDALYAAKHAGRNTQQIRLI